MISVLIVGPGEPANLESPPSIELLRCATPEEALETLSRNRRIDAVMFFDGDTARETSTVLGEEGASWPPLFQAGRSSADGIVPLDPAEILDDLRRRLGE